MNTKIKYLIVVAGPTGVGKTEVAIQLAKHFHTEIISADARQFYREMNIGTAKPSEVQLSEIKHHFVNSLSIHDTYDVGKYEEEALKLLDELYLSHDILILCGGSGLFIHAVLQGLDKLPTSDPEIRNMLEEKLKNGGIEALQNLLKEKDPEYFQTVDQQNPHRIIRALEVCMTTGREYSRLRRSTPAERSFTAINIFLNLKREVLYERINERVDRMVQQGLPDEAESLYKYKSLQALNTVGYKELFDCKDGRYDLQTAIERIKQSTRNYSKRQLTWFKKYLPATEFDPADVERIIKHIEAEMQ